MMTARNQNYQKIFKLLDKNFNSYTVKRKTDKENIVIIYVIFIQWVYKAK